MPNGIDKWTLAFRIVLFVTHFASPKSATFTIGGVSVVNKMFYQELLHEHFALWASNEKPTSGLRSRCVIPLR